MKLRAGTSGYSYKEWHGHFYPEKLPASAMLRYYVGRFATVEIDNTLDVDSGRGRTTMST